MLNRIFSTITNYKETIMKKTFILTSILLMFALLLTGCDEKVVGKKYEFDSFDTEIENNKGFVLKEKKVSYLLYSYHRRH